MTGEVSVELKKALRAHDDKFDYFLLAAAGASIAYALNQAKGLALSWSQICLGVAIFSWGLSFYFGCERLSFTRQSLWVNVVLNDALTENRWHPNDRAALRERGEEIFNKVDDKSGLRSKLQYGLVIFGALAYVAWQINEMYWKAVNS